MKKKRKVKKLTSFQLRNTIADADICIDQLEELREYCLELARKRYVFRDSINNR